MLKATILSILFVSLSVAEAKPIVVAVIDTGIDKSLMNANFLCKSGHKDFTNDGVGLEDTDGHGTHISSVIDKVVKNIKDSTIIKYSGAPLLKREEPRYCQVVLKYFSRKLSNANSTDYMTLAIEHAITLKVDIINISGGGKTESLDETNAIKKAIDAGIKVVVAAGNESTKLKSPHKSCYFPACSSPKLTVVGNLQFNLDKLDPTLYKFLLVPNIGYRSPSSNYGPIVNAWEYGTKVVGLASATKSAKISGTSQACALRTGAIVRNLLKNK